MLNAHYQRAPSKRELALQKRADPRESDVLANLQSFLTAFPYLLEDRRSSSARELLGKRRFYGGCIRTLKMCDWRSWVPGVEAPNDFPYQDHTYYWKVKGLKGPILCTTFPYGGALNGHEEELMAFAACYGFSCEIAPPDLPDLYNPGATVPVAWSMRGVDWRMAGREGAGGLLDTLLHPELYSSTDARSASNPPRAA